METYILSAEDANIIHNNPKNIDISKYTAFRNININRTEYHIRKINYLILQKCNKMIQSKTLIYKYDYDLRNFDKRIRVNGNIIHNILIKKGYGVTNTSCICNDKYYNDFGMMHVYLTYKINWL